MITEPLRFGEFTNRRYYPTERDIIEFFECFGATEKDLEGATLISASYNSYDYEEDAEMVFFKGGKFWSVYGSHCSCYGFEDQWEPSEVPIKFMISNYFSYGNRHEEFKGWIADFVKTIEK